MQRNSVTVFIPIFNPPGYFFDSTIPMLKQQSHPCKIVVISSSGNVSIDGCEVIVIDKKDFNHANTRNIALKYSSDFFMFITQDIIPYDKDLIKNLLNAFNDPKVVVAYARQVPFKSASPSEKFARETNYPSISIKKSKDDLPYLGIKTFFSSNSCAMYKSSYFKAQNGFKPGLNMSEDMEFAARAIMQGYKIAYIADAKVWHSHKYTLKSLYQRYFAIGNFFKNNYWILETVNSYAHIEKSGLKQVIQEIKYILKHNPLYIPKSIAEIITKYIAYKRGLNG